LSPLIELSGYPVLGALWLLGVLNASYATAFVMLSVLYAVVISILAVLLEDIAFRRYSSIRELALLIGAAVLENVGYRHLTVWWRVRAFWEYCRGDLSWGAMERRGVANA
jgi:hypothetical protein